MTFDTFPWALVNVYVVMSMSNWTDIMYPLWDTLSSFVFIFFMSLILIASFFAVNLALVRASNPHLACDVRAHSLRRSLASVVMAPLPGVPLTAPASHCGAARARVPVLCVCAY
jgi:hypothetical protein